MIQLRSRALVMAGSGLPSQLSAVTGSDWRRPLWLGPCLKFD